jgi:hypothetical protein
VGGVDLVAGAGGEVPPHDDRFRECFAAEQDRAGRFAHLQVEFVAEFTEVSQLAREQLSAVDGHRSFEDDQHLDPVREAPGGVPGGVPDAFGGQKAREP